MAKLYARQQREGYGFRPSSGASTPTSSGPGAGVAGQGGSFFPPSSATSAIKAGGSQQARQPQQQRYREREEGEEEDYDHMDRDSMDDLRAGVKEELVKNGQWEDPPLPGQGQGAAHGEGQVQGQELARVQQDAEGAGIVDAEGLGWPGKLHTVFNGILGLLAAPFQLLLSSGASGAIDVSPVGQALRHGGCIATAANSLEWSSRSVCDY